MGRIKVVNILMRYIENRIRLNVWIWGHSLNGFLLNRWQGYPRSYKFLCIIHTGVKIVHQEYSKGCPLNVIY